MRGLWSALVGAGMWFGTSASAEDPAAARFEEQVAPLLAAHCLACHGPETKRGGLDLTTRESVLRGGDSGPALSPNSVEGSLLWQRIAAGEMPPKKPLPPAAQESIRRWLTDGAAWGVSRIDPLKYTSDTRAGYDWWALRPLLRPGLPAASNPDWPREPLDRFVLAKLQHAGLSPSPEAARAVLARRLNFDLLGLPPSPEEVADFVGDTSADAYERFVDRLLASPHYGERWARHWLDVVRFGESQGFERDKLRPKAWRYRDWVVAAINEDMPYDRFVSLQLAGDVLAPQDPAAHLATGYLVAAPWDEVGKNQQSAAMRAVVRQDELEDLVGSVAQTFLALTANCARCHDHKFDPISQVDYYRLAAALGGVHHGERELAASNDELTSSVDYVALQATGRDLRAKIDGLSQSSDFASLRAFQAKLSWIQLRLDLAAGGGCYAVAPKRPEPCHRLERGNPGQPREVVPPAALAAVRGPKSTFDLPASASDAERRQSLAAWIVDPQNPLTARVIVNRIWHYHFGAGLVETPNDFGFNGGRPSHPELLDWLACDLIENGWSLKRLHRRIVLSATYRQAADYATVAARVDRDNRLLWRKSPQRLEAEAVRDAVLAVSGELNATMGGPGFQDFVTKTNNSQFYDPVDPVGWEYQRRSLYRTWIRSGTNKFLDAFDCPDPSTATPKRAVTTTPLQALSLLNNSFVLRMADRFADRLKRDVGDDVKRQVARAYWLAYCRAPHEMEAIAAAEFITHYGLAAFCRVAMNANEFLYVD